jgi:hypothetical protein
MEEPQVKMVYAPRSMGHVVDHKVGDMQIGQSARVKWNIPGPLDGDSIEIGRDDDQEFSEL